jgi:hypothetical protein
MSWLVSEPGTTNFLHYSGHGGQVRPSTIDFTICLMLHQVADTGGVRVSGFDDTIVRLLGA